MREEREREQQLAQQKEFEALAEAEKSSQFSEVSGNFPLEEWALLPDQKILKMSIDHIHPSHLLQQHQQQQPELFDSHLISNQTEDIRVVSETIDLHSSASDEGILTKESSTEELIDRDLDLHLHAHGHDSEEYAFIQYYFIQSMLKILFYFVSSIWASYISQPGPYLNKGLAM